MQVYSILAPFYRFLHLPLQRTEKITGALLKHNVLKGKGLDVGAGPGTLFCYCNHLQLTGLDSSEEMKKLAKKRHPNVAYVIGDAQNLPFAPKEFDFVVMSHFLSISKDPEGVIEEVKRVVKKGGYILIVGHESKSKFGRILGKVIDGLTRSIFFKMEFTTENIHSLDDCTLHFTLKTQPGVYLNLYSV